MTIGGSARPTLTSLDDVRKDDGSNEGGARVGAASRDPQSYPRRWYLSLILYFRGNSERSCPEEADGGDLAAGQHPKPPFSLLSHLPILCGGGGGGGVAVEEEDDDGGGRQLTEEEWWR
jgi:hypothetical protein